MTIPMKYCQPGAFTWDMMFKVFIRGQSYEHVFMADFSYTFTSSKVRVIPHGPGLLTQITLVVKTVLCGSRPQVNKDTLRQGIPRSYKLSSKSQERARSFFGMCRALTTQAYWTNTSLHTSFQYLPEKGCLVSNFWGFLMSEIF